MDKDDTYIKLAVALAKSSIYDGAQYIGKWQRCDVFEPTFADDEPRFIGFPQFIICKNGACRWTASDDESRAVMRELSFGGDSKF